jgi:IgGFc binding protein
MVSAEYKFAVAVANTTSIAATVTIEDGPLATPRVFTVPPNGVHLERLPWQADLKLCMETSWEACATGAHNTAGALVDKAAYHLRSTAPVTVYQFNPLDYTFTGASEASVSNDASLLLPVSAWRGEYYAATWQHNFNAPSELAVIGSQHHTMVTITTRADTPASGNAPAFKAGVPQTIKLDEGSVIEITTITGDLTGTHVVADKPVAVISGHFAARIPQEQQYDDHLEESMFPVATLGKRYMIVPPLTASLDRMAHYVRVVATHDNTTLTYEPAQTGLPTTIAKAGDFVELPYVSNSFLITADHKILVAQYMTGATTRDDGSGDPAMSLVVPIDEFRKSYLVHAPINYIKGNFVDVVAPIDEPILFDGKPLATEPIPSTDYALGRASLIDGGPGNDGNHTITGAKPFGITVYGYAPYTSYWYPGGLDFIDVN